MLKVSVVNYLNSFPFVYGLTQFSFSHPFDLQKDIPSVCAEKLISNQVDIGLVPVAVLPFIPDCEIISNYCISADGKVDSVKLYSRVPLENIKEIILDYQSRTSVQLLKILCREKWKISPLFIPAEPGFENSAEAEKAVLVIGDRTFYMNGTFPYEYDLAEEWQQLTNLPFVFAVWASNKKINNTVFINEFNEALKLGLTNIENSIMNYQYNPTLFDPYFYLTKRINYQLNEQKKLAIEKFLAMILQ